MTNWNWKGGNCSTQKEYTNLKLNIMPNHGLITKLDRFKTILLLGRAPPLQQLRVPEKLISLKMDTE